MKAHRSSEGVHIVVFEPGEDPMEGLARFAADVHIGGAGFTGLGAFSAAMLAYFDVEVGP